MNVTGRIRLDINIIRNKYNNGEYKTDLPYPKEGELPDTHIFDEDQSVKWNRQKVEEFNNDLELRKKAYFEDSERLLKKLRRDVTNYLISSYGFSQAQAEKIESYVYTEWHSSNDYFSYIDEIANLIKTLL